MNDDTQKPQPPANLPMPLEPETKKDSFSRPTPPPSPAEAGFGGQSPLSREGGLRPSLPPLPPLPPRPVMPPPPPVIPSRPSFAPPAPSVPSRPTLPPSFSIPTPPSSPKPSAPDISVRTLKSDLEALKQSPSGMPTAKPITPPTITGPIKVETPKKKSKLLFIIIGVLVVGVAFALAGYFVIFPYFFPAQTPPPPTATPAGTLTPPAPTAPAQIAPHQSLLKTPAETQAPLFLASLDSFTAQQTLLSEANSRPANNNVLKELLISDSNGQVAFPNFLPLLLTELSASQLNSFEDDFTALVYYDTNGFWPIYVAKLKSGADLTSAKNLIKGLETSANLTNLYLENPGTPTGNFKSGSISGVATRYLPYSKTGASLNYAWIGDKLVISASFNGLKRVLSSL